MGQASERLRTETATLSQALRAPHTRGKWGEIHLKRVVELSGMHKHCDFIEQTTIGAEGATQRPDLIVKLPGGKHLVVDAKVPLTAYLESHVEFLQARADVDGLCQATRSFFRFLGRHPEMVRLLSWTLAMRRVLLGEGAQLELTRALMQRLVRRIEDAQAAGTVRAGISAR